METRAGRLRTGGDDDLVGAERSCLLAVDRVVDQDLDAELRQLSLVPLDQLGDLAPSWLTTGEPECTAQLGSGLDQGHVVAALGGDASSLEPGGTTADDEYGPAHVGRLERVAAPFELTSRRGVHETGDPVVAGSPTPTHLVARDAAANVLGATAQRLVHEVGVGDLSAYDAHHVGLARRR